MSKKPIHEPAVIPFAENLHEVLPKDYTKNLALLPLEQREAISEDHRRRYLAETIFDKRRNSSGLAAIAKANKAIVEGLAIMQPDAYREDMRRRLNILKGKLK